MSTIKEITTVSEFEDHLKSLKPTTLLVISFHAPWAAPCAQMATILSTLALEYPVTDPPSTSWVSLNAEDLSDISEGYNVTKVPFLALVRNGQTLDTVAGNSAVKVRDTIERHASGSSTTSTTTAAATATTATTASTGEDITSTAAIDHGTSSTPAVNAAPVEKTIEDPEKAKQELFERLGDLVKAVSVMLFMKGTPSEPKCGFSRQMVAILREKAVKYGFFNILADDEVRQGLKEYADWPTYPQLWVNGELVGGLDIVKEELEGDPDFFAPYSVKSAEVVAHEAS